MYENGGVDLKKKERKKKKEEEEEKQTLEWVWRRKKNKEEDEGKKSLEIEAPKAHLSPIKMQITTEIKALCHLYHHRVKKKKKRN